MSKRIATLKVRLPGFVEPDTDSQREGFLEPGRYIVEEYRESSPDADTDYARVQAPTLGASDTWICTRWKDQDYAVITDAPDISVERHSFEDDPGAVPEEAMIDLLPKFYEFKYDLDDARYPYDLPGIHVPLAPPGFNNCCTFVEALLARAWADTHDDFQWSPKRHRQMMIMSSDDFFSPVTAAVEAGMAIPVSDPDTPPHPWTLVQGWRNRWRGGHTFLIVDHHPDTDRVLTLESNSSGSYRLDGVGFRKIGNLRDIDDGAPPSSWWEQEDLWTWDLVCSTYRFRQLAWLRVTDRSWSGL